VRKPVNPTIELLRFVGSPYLSSSSRRLNIGRSIELYNHSLKNRLFLLFLDATKRTEAFNSLGEIYDEQISKYTETYEAIARISRTLSKAHIEYAIFKTLRPYISTTVDIDIIIFGSTLDYKKANETTKRAGYKKLGCGPASTTFLDPKMRMGIDLYKEVAVSYVPYIDKTKLVGSIIETQLPGRECVYVKTLTCEADLICIVAHSIIKENMYLLSEYYTYVYYLRQLDINRFAQLARQTHLESALRTHTTITTLLYKVAHGTLPEKLRMMIDKVGLEKHETTRIMKNGFKMPHKYHPMTIARCLLDIIREEKTRRGIIDQTVHGFNKDFLKDFFNKINAHITRETY